MVGLPGLPERIFKFIESGVVAEIATVSKAGIPIDTPSYYFPSDDLSTIDVANGVVNPTKGARARRNPKVGYLMEGAANEPVVSIRGHAAIRDADIQANTIRYLAETGFKGISHGLTWAEARKTVTYWARIIMEVTPARVYWWDTPAAMDQPPHVWNAPAGTVFPLSDPAPPGKSSAVVWPVRDWRIAANEVAPMGIDGHLTLCDDDGYPLPIRARKCELVDEGFRLVLPKGAPWRGTGKGTLSFAGVAIFVGDAIPDGATTLFKVERVLPEHPTMKDTSLVLQPTDEMRAKLVAKLDEELKRRGKPVPHVPEELPAPTRLAKLRQARLASDAPITGINDEMGNRTT
jgi:hypothetical protein